METAEKPWDYKEHWKETLKTVILTEDEIDAVDRAWVYILRNVAKEGFDH